MSTTIRVRLSHSDMSTLHPPNLPDLVAHSLRHFQEVDRIVSNLIFKLLLLRPIILVYHEAIVINNAADVSVIVIFIFVFIIFIPRLLILPHLAQFFDFPQVFASKEHNDIMLNDGFALVDS